MSPMWEAREEAKAKKHVSESVVLSWFAHTGPYVTPRQKRKKHVSESVVFSWLAHTSLYVGRKIEKIHVLESVVFSWFAHTGPYVTPMWGQPKNHVLESVVFSWFARTGPYVTHVEAREEAKTKKPRFRKCGFFVVCPYGPLCHPCGGKGRGKNQKTKF